MKEFIKRLKEIKRQAKVLLTFKLMVLL